MKIFKIILVLIIMITIFMFSNQPASESQALSNGVVYKTKEIINKDCSNNKCMTTYGNKIIRKVAHFTLYFILGITVYLLLKEYKLKRIILYTILFCLIYAISDEIHQIFIPGRAFQVLDITIDTIGSIIAILLMELIKK